MPTLNQDGTLNYNTDTAFDMDDDDEYYHFVCGLISASMQVIGRRAGELPIPFDNPGDNTDTDKDKTLVDPTAVGMNVKTQQQGLVCCLNIGSHFYNYVYEQLTEEEQQEIIARFNYQKKNGDPRWDISLDHKVQYFLVNTSDTTITFDKVYIMFGAAGISNWQSAVTQDCQPYAAEIRGGSLNVNLPFEISAADRQTLETYFEINKSSTVDVGSPVIEFNARYNVSVPSGAAVLLLSVDIYTGGRTVYINGETPVKMTPNFCGLSYDIVGAAGSDGHGGFMTTPSYAYNTQTGVTAGIQRHCSRDICTGARWYERWSEDYPGTYFTFTKNGETVDKLRPVTQKTTTSTTVRVSTHIKNDTTSTANLRINMYGQEYTYSVPAGFIGQTDFDIEVPPVSSTSDNTSLEISSQFNISIDKGEVSNTIVQIVQDPTIPANPVIRSDKQQQLGLVDKLVIMLAGAQNPSVSDGLVLVDSASVTQQRGAIDHIVSDGLVLVDSTYVTQQEQPSGDTTVNDILVMSDKAIVRSEQPFTGSAVDGLTLTDTTNINK